LDVLEVKYDGFRREIRINIAGYANFCDMWRNFPGQLCIPSTAVRLKLKHQLLLLTFEPIKPCFIQIQ